MEDSHDEQAREHGDVGCRARCLHAVEPNCGFYAIFKDHLHPTTAAALVVMVGVVSGHRDVAQQRRREKQNGNRSCKSQVEWGRMLLLRQHPDRPSVLKLVQGWTIGAHETDSGGSETGVPRQGISQDWVAHGISDHNTGLAMST